MAFNIEDFKSNTKMGFSRNSYFFMSIYPPKFWAGDNPSFLSYLCSGAQLPGISILAPNIQKWGYGPSRKYPVGVVHPDITLTVYSDGAGNAIDFFDQWTRNVVTYGDPQGSINGSSFGLVQYPDNYMTDLDLFYMSESGNPQELIRCRFIDAFPIGTGAINLSWAGRAQISQFVVPFNYRTFFIVKNQVDWDTGSIVPNGMYYDNVYMPINSGDLFSVSQGIIGLNGLTASFSSSLQTVLSPLTNIVQKVQLVGGIAQSDVMSLNSVINNATASLNIGI